MIFPSGICTEGLPKLSALLDFPAARFVLEIDPCASLGVKDRADCGILKNQNFIARVGIPPIFCRR
jgi:hypothetical protein